jgi:uncharacterized membrane protein YciS (DUF1049 family)
MSIISFLGMACHYWLLPNLMPGNFWIRVKVKKSKAGRRRTMSTRSQNDEKFPVDKGHQKV